MFIVQTLLKIIVVASDSRNSITTQVDLTDID